VRRFVLNPRGRQHAVPRKARDKRIDRAFGQHEIGEFFQVADVASP